MKKNTEAKLRMDREDMSQENTTIFPPPSGEVPPLEALDLLQESRDRTGLVIRARWVLLGILAAYGIIPYIFFQDVSADLGPITAAHCVFPVAAWSFVAIYNALLQYSYKWFARIRSLNKVQLLLDLLFITVVVHSSGGVVSWFWTMYLVLILESAMIMDRDSDTYSIALGAMIAYGGLLTLEYHGWIQPVPMPFENNALQSTFSYEIIKWGWVSISLMCIAFTGVFLMKTIRRREERLRNLVAKDSLTSLYNRRYFFYRLNSEIQRAKRYRRILSLLILDVDHFKKVNDRYGHLEGDEILRVLSETILSNIRRSDRKPNYELDIPCRYGGEEIAVILPETGSDQASIAAERLRTKIETRCASLLEDWMRKEREPRGEEVQVTVSIGVASYPEHAAELEELVLAADNAMYSAKQAGKNRVAVAETPSPALQA